VRASRFPRGISSEHAACSAQKARHFDRQTLGAGSLRDQLIAAPAGGTVMISATGTISLLGPLRSSTGGVNLLDQARRT